MTQVNEKGILITKSIQKYLDIIAKGQIEESELISMKSLINKNEQAKDVIFEALQDKELMLSDAQNTKGYNFLMDQWKTGRGIERKNNPFGYREQEILKTFKYFEFAGFYDAGNYNRSFYLPLYNCIGEEGAFQYYYNGEVNIIG